jgi:hypothetical protein
MESCEITQEAQFLQPDISSQPPAAVPRRIEELRNPKSSSRKKPKSRSTEAVSKDPRRTHSRPYRQKVLVLGASESFSTQVKIFRILGRIPKLGDHVPLLLSHNAANRTYTVQYTRRELVQFEDEARWIHLKYQKIQELKDQLLDFVMLMYKNGVEYHLYPHQIYLYKPAANVYARELFLESVEDSDLLDMAELDLEKHRERSRAQINRIFAPLEIWTFQEETAKLTDSVKEDLEVIESTIRDKNIAIDAAKADLTEAQAIMAGTFKIIKDACANVEGLQAVTNGLEASVMRSRGVWNDAQFGKEYVETSLKQIDVLTSRKNALIQKYGGPMPNDRVGVGEITPQPIKPEENVLNMKITNSPVEDAKVEEESDMDDEVAAGDANAEEKARFEHSTAKQR